MKRAKGSHLSGFFGLILGHTTPIQALIGRCSFHIKEQVELLPPEKRVNNR